MTTTESRWEAMATRVLGYTGLFVIGAMAWTCDRLGVTARTPRPAVRPALRGARS